MRQTVHEFWWGDKYCYGIFEDKVVIEIGWFSRADGHGDPQAFDRLSDIVGATQALKDSLEMCLGAKIEP
jgi:hypothetical protein